LKIFAILIIFATSTAVALTPSTTALLTLKPTWNFDSSTSVKQQCSAHFQPVSTPSPLASLNASYPPARLHFQGDYLLISENCAKQGHLLILLNNHFSPLGSLEGVQDLSQFNLREHITNISDEYRATFLLSNSARDEALSSLRTYENKVIAEVESLRLATVSRSTDIETYLFPRWRRTSFASAARSLAIAQIL
jgi:hypothetical protein